MKWNDFSPGRTAAAIVDGSVLKNGRFRMVRDQDGMLQLVGENPNPKKALVMSESEVRALARALRRKYRE